jgi:hypothetical protein
MNLKPLLCAATLALLNLPAEAGRPLQTDDAGVLDRAGCELEAAAQQDKAEGERSTSSGVQLGCGIGWNSQLGVGVSTAQGGGLRQTGAMVGGKTGLWQAEVDNGNGAALALSWQVAADRATGEGWRHTGHELRLLGTRPLNDALTVHANLGHAYSAADRTHSTLWGLALEHAPLGAIPGLAPMAEVVGDDRGTSSWNLGLRYTGIADTLSVDFSYGRTFKQGGNTLLTAGIKFAF